ncbi:DUF4919 domain-containing protein [Bacteroides sp. 214]|uniref:DUF4919 domain-containing protein n=1 Tax=Bacteroides sp. 214 TaxID=2302935 RepID=UPI0013D04A2B|nr:DUF4919 domain-containing protein [Bacteroides sp. 214]NDW12701.1 DUF4919 domain-containing protein [Bacteroides sp. 214]
MKNYLIGLILLSSIQFATAQNELSVDYGEIKKTVENKESEYFYPKLLQRFNNFDESLTLEEYALIYYGFSFQDDYIKNQPDERILSEIMKDEDYNKLIVECENILKRNPVSLKANDCMGYALFKLNKPESEWKKYQNRFRGLRKAIVYSGNGLSCETSFKVIYVSDEYSVLYDYFEISEIYSQALTEDFCDKFEIKPSNYYQVKEVYFDISRKLIRQQELMDSLPPL